MALGIFAVAFEKRSLPPYTWVRWRGMVRCGAFATQAWKSMVVKTSFAGALVRKCTDRVRRTSLRARGCCKVLRSVKACPEISAVRNVWATASRAIVQWKNGVCLIEDSDGSSGSSGELAFPPPVWTWGAKLVQRLRTIDHFTYYCLGSTKGAQRGC